MAFNMGQQAHNLQPWLTSSPGLLGNWTVIDKVPADMMSLVDPHWYQVRNALIKINKQIN